MMVLQRLFDMENQSISTRFLFNIWKQIIINVVGRRKIREKNLKSQNIRGFFIQLYNFHLYFFFSTSIISCFPIENQKSICNLLKSVKNLFVFINDMYRNFVVYYMYSSNYNNLHKIWLLFFYFFYDSLFSVFFSSDFIFFNFLVFFFPSSILDS